MSRDSRGASPNADRVVRSWLHEDRHEDATRVLDTVLVEVDTTPQRRSGGTAWRSLFVDNNLMRVGLAAAAVVIIAIIAINLLPGSPGPGAAPSVSPGASNCCPLGYTSPVNPGPHVLWDDVHGGFKITVTVPSAGWYGDENPLVYHNNVVPPDGAGLFVLQGGDVPSDPCAWLTPPYPDTTETVDGYVTALASQASRDASVPLDVTVAGYAGKALTLHVPEDAVFSDCDQGLFVTLTLTEFGNPIPVADRRAQGPGQIDEFWIVDVDGHSVLFDIAYGKATPQSVIDEMRAMVQSAVFGPYVN